MPVVVGGIDAASKGDRFCRDQRFRLQAGQSYEFDQFSLMNVPQRLMHIGGKRIGIRVVLFGQSLNDLGH
jgi:hypothetical protein